MADQEEWKPIPFGPGYEASSLGGVRIQAGAGPDLWVGKFLNRRFNYWYIELRLNGQIVKYRRCRLIAMVFHGQPTADKELACHIDGNKTNDSSANLKWGSRLDNAADARAHGVIVRGRGIWNAKLTEDKVRIILAMKSSGISHAEIARRNSTNVASVRRVIQGVCWTHVDPHVPRYPSTWVPPTRIKAATRRQAAPKSKEIPLPIVQSGPELWAAVPGSAGYEVSNYGRVRSWRIRYGKGGIGNTSRIRKPHINKSNGYSYYTILTNSIPKPATVHRLIALAFLGPPPPGKNLACHKDGNPSNNCLANIRWGSSKDNQEDMVRHGHSQQGAKQWKAKLSDSKVVEIILLYDKGMGIRALAKQFGVGRSTIRRVIQGDHWRHVVISPS